MKVKIGYKISWMSSIYKIAHELIHEIFTLMFIPAPNTPLKLGILCYSVLEVIRIYT